VRVCVQFHSFKWVPGHVFAFSVWVLWRRVLGESGTGRSVAQVPRTAGGAGEREEVLCECAGVAMAAAMVCSAAGGALALLDEPEPALQVAGLRRLDDMATHYWAELSTSIEKIETMYEDESFQERKLAALVAAKVFYHLGELDDSMTYALYAEDLFDITARSSFVETIVNKCVDKYIAVRASREGLLPGGDADGEGAAYLADGLIPLLESVVERMFERCFGAGQFHHAIGIALEACRLDKLEETLRRNPAASRAALLKYTLRMSQSLVPNRAYRHRVFRVLIDAYRTLDEPDHSTICQCLMFLDDADGVAQVLIGLAREGGDAALVAYQIAFDLYETDLQSFMWRMHAALEASTKGEDVGDEFKARVAKLLRIVSGEVPVDLTLRFLYSKNHADMQVLDLMKSSVDRNNVCHGGVIMSNAMMHAGTTVDGFIRNNLDWMGRATNWAKFTAIAGLGVVHKGHVKEGMNLLQPYLPHDVVDGTKQYIEGGSLYALGLIHSNHKDAAIKDYLLTALQLSAAGGRAQGPDRDTGISSTGVEVVKHGACLGLGLTMMGTADESVFMTLMDEVSDPLKECGAVTGEAAGTAMGLVMIGQGAEVAKSMLEQMPLIKLEKAIRGLSLGCALAMYGLEEGADGIVEQMTLDQDPIVRYGGMQAIAMAYHGTGSDKAIRKLLHFAVTDVNNDVRRAAVMCLGFVMYSAPDQCTRLVTSLSESYNPHVRYGAAMAVGISNAGTGNMQAVLLLQPMRNDPVDFVRQGASIALAQILLQQEKVVSRQAGKAKEEAAGPAPGGEDAAASTSSSSAKDGDKAAAGGKKGEKGADGEKAEESKDPLSSQLREKFIKSIRDKHEDTMTKLGSILASGILDAGGRNMTLCLKNRWGHSKMCGVVGLMCFTQFWYWYPMVHFLSLALSPTAIIGLNADLEVPDMEVVCKAQPSEFAYVPPMKEAVQTRPKLAKEAKLSISQRKQREEEEKKKAEAEKREKEAAASAAPGDGDAMEVEGGAGAAEPKAEPLFEMLQNPSRVLPRQERFVHLTKEGRYRLVSNRASGIVMLRDTRPGEAEAIVSPPDIPTPANQQSKDEDAEPKCPAPFYVEDDDSS